MTRLTHSLRSSEMLAVSPDVKLAPGADENGLATMLSDLVRQNIVDKPYKNADFVGLNGRVSIVAEDVDVALTLQFSKGGHLVIHDGIVGIPDVTIRGPSEAILALSNMPLTTRLGLPIPRPGDREAKSAVVTVARALRQGKLHLYGIAFHFPLMSRLSHIMSVNG